LNLFRTSNQIINRRSKFYVKTSLIFFVILERFTFVLTSISFSYFILYKLFRGTLDNSIDTYIRVIFFILLDLVGFSIYRIKEIRFRRAKKNWVKIFPIVNKNIESKRLNFRKRIYYHYISDISDYSIYGNSLIIVFLLSILIIFSNNMRTAILSWIITCFFTFYTFKNYLIIIELFKIKKLFKYFEKIYKFLSLRFKVNKFQILNSYLTLTLIICFIIFPPSHINVIEIIIALFGIRQVLSSIRSFLYKEGTKGILI